eukprot:5102068-Pleurochrysis_carterae.AAC.7
MAPRARPQNRVRRIARSRRPSARTTSRAPRHARVAFGSAQGRGGRCAHGCLKRRRSPSRKPGATRFAAAPGAELRTRQRQARTDMACDETRPAGRAAARRAIGGQ